MSAYMVDKAHIDAIVTIALNGPAGVRSGWWTPPQFGPAKLRADVSNADQLGEMLVKENLSSIHSRYPDTATNPDATPGPDDPYFLFPYSYPVRARFSPSLGALAALKAIQCYEYQACEHEEWEASDTWKFCADLKDKLISHLPGWDDAPWGV